MTKTVAIAGLGAIGLPLARALDSGVEGLRLIAIASREQVKALANLVGFHTQPRLVDLEDLAAADIIVEAAPASVFERVAVPAIEAGRIFVPASVGALLPFASLLLLQFGSATALLVLDQQSQNNSKTIRQSMHARDLLSTAIFGNLSLQHALFMLPLNAPEINQNLTETIAAFDALSNELKEPKNLAAASAHADKNLRICRDQARQGQEMMRAGTYRNNGERRVWPPISRAMHEMAADTGTLNAFFVEEEAQTVKAIGNEGWARRLSLIILLVTTVLEMILTAVTVILLNRGLPPSGRP